MSRIKANKIQQIVISQNLLFENIPQSDPRFEKDSSCISDNSLLEEEATLKKKNFRLQQTIERQELEINMLWEEIEDLQKQERQNKVLQHQIKKLKKKWKDSRQFW